MILGVYVSFKVLSIVLSTFYQSRLYPRFIMADGGLENVARAQ